MCLEVNDFVNGTRRAAIISQKGSTGISLHADRTFSNQTQRVQVCIQIPWVPENCIQQLGRTNRSNQIIPPIYIIVATDIPGELRFTTIFLERMRKMVRLFFLKFYNDFEFEVYGCYSTNVQGAICQGERRSTSGFSNSVDDPFSESPATATIAAQLVVEDLIEQGNSVILLSLI